MIPYQRFDHKTCFPLGWKQNNEDCWLDSTLYALFAPTATAAIFADILDVLHSSNDGTEKKIAKYLSNYLRGLEDPKWRNNCKQVCKDFLVKALIRWNEEHQYVLFAEGLENENFIDMGYGQYAAGQLSVIMKFFNQSGGNKIHFEAIEPRDIQCVDVENNAIHVVVEKVLSDHAATENTLVIIHIPIFDPKRCQDETKLQDLKDLHGFELQSVVFGKGIHITAAALCEDKFVLYDNQRKKGGVARYETTKDEMKHFKHSDELAFVFRKVQGTATATSSVRSRTLLRSESSPRNFSGSPTAAHASSSLNRFSQSPIRLSSSPIVISSETASAAPASAAPASDVIVLSSSSGGKKTLKKNHLKKSKKTSTRKTKQSKGFLSRLFQW